MEYFDDKAVGENVTLTFDYAGELNGETITSVDAVQVELVDGVDANPAAILAGAPASTITGKVLLPVAGGKVNAAYRLICLANTATRKLQRDGILRIVHSVA
jgi:hypothetical protein